MLYFIEMTITVQGEDEMKAFGQRVGSQLTAGDYIELVGDVGAGKTTFAKGVAAGMGITETVQSPTFTINRTYDSPNGLRLSHYDFYRLSDPGIMTDELAESIDDENTVIIIEWGEVVAAVLPTDHLRIEITSPSEDMRSLKLLPTGKRSEALAGSIG